MSNVIYVDFINKCKICDDSIKKQYISFEDRFKIFVNSLTVCFIKHDMKLDAELIEELNLFLNKIYDKNIYKEIE